MLDRTITVRAGLCRFADAADMHDDVVELARKLDLPDPSLRPLRCAFVDCTATDVKACARCKFVCFCGKAHQLEYVYDAAAALTRQGVATASDQLQVARDLAPSPARAVIVIVHVLCHCASPSPTPRVSRRRHGSRDLLDRPQFLRVCQPAHAWFPSCQPRATSPFAP